MINVLVGEYCNRVCGNGAMTCPFYTERDDTWLLGQYPFTQFDQEHNLLVQIAKYLGMFEKVKNQAMSSQYYDALHFFGEWAVLNFLQSSSPCVYTPAVGYITHARNFGLHFTFHEHVLWLV